MFHRTVSLILTLLTVTTWGGCGPDRVEPFPPFDPPQPIEEEPAIAIDEFTICFTLRQPAKASSQFGIGARFGSIPDSGMINPALAMAVPPTLPQIDRNELGSQSCSMTERHGAGVGGALAIPNWVSVELKAERASTHEWERFFRMEGRAYEFVTIGALKEYVEKMHAADRDKYFPRGEISYIVVGVESFESAGYGERRKSMGDSNGKIITPFGGAGREYEATSEREFKRTMGPSITRIYVVAVDISASGEFTLSKIQRPNRVAATSR